MKTAAKFLRTEPVNCAARAVIAKSRARHVHVMCSIYLQVVKVHLFNYSISRVSCVHSSRTTDESDYGYPFVRPSENQNAFDRSPSAQMPTSTSSLYCNTVTQRHLVQSDFLQRSTRFEIRRRVLKNDEIQKEHTHRSLSLSLSLSLLADPRMHFDFPERICMHQSPSLFLSI